MKTPFSSMRLLLVGCAVVLASLSACRSMSALVTDSAPDQGVAESTQQPSQVGAVDVRGWQVATGDDGLFDLAWRPLGGVVPRNEVFELEVMLLREGQLLSGPQVRVRGWMPDHGHGLVRTPLVTNLEDGRHRVEGLLLHMRGLWQLFFDVTDGQQTDCVSFELSL